MNIYLAVLSLSYGMWGLLSCGMQSLVPDQGMNLGTLHWEHGVLATGPPVKTPNYSLSLHHIYLVIALSRSCNYALLLYLLVYDLSPTQAFQSYEESTFYFLPTALFPVHETVLPHSNHSVNTG